MTQYHAIVRRSRLVKIKRCCAAFKAACKFTIADSRTAIYFLAILLDGVKEKRTAMLNFMKPKNQLKYCRRLFLFKIIKANSRIMFLTISYVAYSVTLQRQTKVKRVGNETPVPLIATKKILIFLTSQRIIRSIVIKIY